MADQDIGRWYRGAVEEFVQFLHNLVGCPGHWPYFAPAQAGPVILDSVKGRRKTSGNVRPAQNCGHQPGFEDDARAIESPGFQQMQPMRAQVDESAGRGIVPTVTPGAHGLIVRTSRETKESDERNPYQD